MFKNISVSDAQASKTNPRGAVQKDQAFKDLVASIKEKGVLVPVIARPAGKKFEVVAGNRRLAAASEAGLAEIPADVREMDDNEAREVQIIENLQRSDIHPLEEAAAYLKLVQTIADIKAVAAKVGKAEHYVHGRILLNNLAEEVKKSYRAGEINDGHAAEIAKLSPAGDQQKTVKHVKQRSSYGGTYAVKDLRDWINENIVDELEYQPWLKDKEAAAAVGPCKACPKNTNTLFGETAEGACSVTGCHSQKMKKYIDYQLQKNPGIKKIATNYSSRQDVLSDWKFDKVGKTTKGAVPALIVEGRGRGKIVFIKLHKDHSSEKNEMTPEERKKHEEKIRKEKEAAARREVARLAKESAKTEKTLSAITWPLKEKHLEPIFDMVVENSSNVDEIATRRNIEGDKDEKGNYKDAAKDLGAWFAKSDARTKLQLIVELLIADTWNSDKVIKKFN